MQYSSQINIQQLTYTVADKTILQNINLSLGRNKTDLIGKNGIGKSTLLKLILGEIISSSDNINIPDRAFASRFFRYPRVGGDLGKHNKNNGFRFRGNDREEGNF